MAYPAAAGHPQHSGTMIPEIWSGKILAKFYETTVFNAIANTEYEGDIKGQGDLVHIRTTPSIMIKEHKKGQKLNYETPQPELVDLPIDKGNYWAFISDDVDKHQADYNYVDDWTRDAAEQLKIYIDRQIMSSVYADAHAGNQGATAGVKSGSFNLGAAGAPVQLDKLTIIDTITGLGTVLDEQNVPEMGRYVVLPPWACHMIKNSELKDASLAGDGTSILRNGRVGMIDRFEIYMSNLLDVVTDGTTPVTNMIFGQKKGLTFASQLTENEGPMRSPDFFGDLYRGLQVYGYKVIKPEAFGHLYAYK